MRSMTPPTATKINQVEKEQRRAARFACNRFHNISLSQKCLKIYTGHCSRSRRLWTRFIMFYKIIHSNSPFTLQILLSLLILEQNTHIHTALDKSRQSKTFTGSPFPTDNPTMESATYNNFLLSI